MDTIEIAQREFLDQLGLKHSIPPRHLQERASGAYYPEFFLHGSHLAEHIAILLRCHQVQLEAFERVLDFGCGCGRILIPLSARLASRNVYGADIDPEAVRWCQENLEAFGGFELNPHIPPSPFPSDFFDFIYGVSVFTHLPEDLQFQWLEELQRIVRPGGFLVLTVHGNATHQNLGQTEKEKLFAKGFLGGMSKRSTFSGLPDFYQTSYHTESYIQEYWSPYFKVLEIAPQGVGGIQDGVLLQYCGEAG